MSEDDATIEGLSAASAEWYRGLSELSAEWYRREAEQARLVSKAVDEFQVSKESQSMATIREIITEKVDAEARRMHRYGYGRDRPGYTVEKARVELWLTKEGKELADLLRSRVADLTPVEAKSAIFKDKDDEAVWIRKTLDLLEDPFPH